MINIHFENRVYPCREDQTVLDVLLDNGHDIPYSCRMGVCVTCIMQAVAGNVSDQAREGIRKSLIERGQFLPCVCQPTTDMTISNINQLDLFSTAEVVKIEKFSNDICRVFLEPTTPLYYRAGQFMNLRRDDGLVRSYSLASVPSLDKTLEFHIKRLPNGLMSNWILDELRPGYRLGIQGPTGNCLYEAGTGDQDMLLIGNGTGLAPLVGIARDALSSGHTGSIKLYHGSQNKIGIYLDKELRALASEHDNFHYIPCISKGNAQKGYCQGRANDIALTDNPNLKGWRVFICGYPPMIDCARVKVLAAGASIEDIYVDPYELKNLRNKIRN